MTFVKLIRNVENPFCFRKNGNEEMKVCIFGAGAIGGFLAAYLSKADNEVSLIARGSNLEAYKEKGIKLYHGDRFVQAFPFATNDSQEIGTVDLVFVTVKAPGLLDVGKKIRPLLGNETKVVFAMNGIPWWYGLDSSRENKIAKDTLDPSGILHREVTSQRIVGCVVDCPAFVDAPGVIISKRNSQGIFTLGLPKFSGTRSLEAVSKSLFDAGLQEPVVENFEQAVWNKLIVNLSRSPLAVLTGVNEMELAYDDEITEITKEMILEAAQVADAHGIKLELDWDRLLKADYRSEHRSSMLQDWDGKRPMEIDAILKVVCLFAKKAGVRSPTMNRVLSLLTMKARAAGIYDG